MTRPRHAAAGGHSRFGAQDRTFGEPPTFLLATRPSPLASDVLVLNGPNLNLLGEREPGVYGRTSLAEIERELREAFPAVAFTFAQSNHAGDLIDRLHKAHAAGASGAVLNPGGFSHTSVALRDAVASVGFPVVEVHLSNVHARERFRHRLVVAGASKGVIAGLGPRGYHLAVQALLGLDAGR